MTAREVSSERASEERLGQIATDKDNFYRPEIKAMAQELLALRSSVKTESAQCCVCGKTGLSTVEGDGGTECQLDDGRWTCSQDCYYTAVDWFSQPPADRQRILSTIEAPAAEGEAPDAYVDWKSQCVWAAESIKDPAGLQPVWFRPSPAASSEVTEAALKAINKLPRHVMETSDNNGDVFVSLRRVRASLTTALQGDRP